MKRERDDMCVGEGGGQGEARGIYACASGHRGVKRRNCVLVQAQREREVVKRKTDGESMDRSGVSTIPAERCQSTTMVH